MSARIKQRTLLILKGITFEDLEEISEITVSSVFTPLPRRFESVASWPESSNLRCWHCDLPINGPPKFVPLTFTMANGEYICNTEGVFNRWGCAVAYIDYTFSGQKREQARQTIKIMCSKIRGEQISYINPAPPRTLMVQYGGDLSEDEYLRGIPL